MSPRVNKEGEPHGWIITFQKGDETFEKLIDTSNPKDEISQLVNTAVRGLYRELAELRKPAVSKYDKEGKKLSQEVIEAQAKYKAEQIPHREYTLGVLEGDIRVPIKLVYTTNGVLLALQIPLKPKD